MEYEGQNISSRENLLSINIKRNKNTAEQLEQLQKLEQPIANPIITHDNIKHKMFVENNTPFIMLRTNLTLRPLKMIVDTGATIGIIVDGVIDKEREISGTKLKIFGIGGHREGVETIGIVDSETFINGQILPTKFHILKNAHLNVADGLLGFDFLRRYKARIDMENEIITFKLHEYIPPETPKTQRTHLYKEKLTKRDLETLMKIYGELKNENNTSASVKQNYIEDPEIEENNENENKGQTSTNYQVHNRKKSEKLDDEYIQAANFYSKQYKEFSDRKAKKTKDITGNERSNRNSERNEAKKMCKWQDKPSENEERIEHISGDQYVYMMNGFDENKITVTKEEEGILLRAEEIYGRLDLEKCSTPEKKYVHQICVKYPFQFFMEGDILGNTTVIQHRIKLLPNTKTINIRQYRIPHFHKKILQDMINDYEEQGIIEKCQSPFNSPAILVGKKDDKGDKTDFRFVVDYRKLNESSELYNFPIPFIDDILDGLSGCKIFTTLDIKGAFHQITMEKSSRDYTAFTAGNFQYRWVRMPMGLSSAPLT